MTKSVISLMSFPKCGLHFFVFKIGRVIQHLDSFIVFYINSNLNKFPNISMNYEGKNGRPRFGNPETNSLWCWMVDYEIISMEQRQYRSRRFIRMILGQPVFCRHLLLHCCTTIYMTNNADSRIINHKTVKFHFSL